MTEFQATDRPPLIIVTSTLPVEVGDGVPRFILDLATAMSSEFDVTILAPHSDGAKVQERIAAVNIRRHRYFWPERLERLSAGGVVAVNLGAWLARAQVPLMLISQTVALLRVVRQTGAKVVNAHWLVPGGAVAAVVTRLTSVRLVLHVHAGDVYLLRRWFFGGVLARWVLKSSSRVLAAGSHVRDTLDQLVGFSSEAEVRPMGVWVDRFRPSAPTPAHDPYVVFVGRFVEKKGITYLLHAMVKVRERRPDVGLKLVGSGPLDRQIRREVAELLLADAVTFTGSVGHQDVVGHLQAAAVACVPSIIDSRGETEGMPTVVIEAMAAGTRVVATNVDGIPDVLKDRKNGWLAQPADSVDLARQLLAALEDSDGDARTRAASATAQGYDWSEVGRRYALTIHGVVDGVS